MRILGQPCEFYLCVEVLLAGLIFDFARIGMAFIGPVRVRPRRLSALSVFHSKSFLYGALVWARRALNSQKRRFPARAQYYINQATHSPRLVQLSGTFTWAFLLAGPCFGLLSDRFDRRGLTMCVLCAELALSVLVGLLLLAGRMRPALMLGYMLASSVCMVLDTTR